ncbi:MAG: MFS transporter [Firmicutes bacterium]|nr:MFS transporter [Bacillota bacterium]
MNDHGGPDTRARLALPLGRGAAGPLPSGYRWTVLVNTTVGGFMASLDGSILTVSLPTIARDLHTGVGLMLWIMMGYTVVITALLLPLGRLADMRGRVRFYFAGFVVFTLGSALSGSSLTGEMLLLGRLVQGVGAALMWSNSTAILTDAFPAQERGMALGINQVAILAGSIGGLVLGGVITSLLGWRWIFFVNVPVGAFGALWTATSLREIGRRAEGESIDVPGVALFVSGLVLVLLALTRVVAGDRGAVVPALFTAGFAVLLAFVLVERHQPSPMMDFALFRLRAFTFGNASQFLNALARGALMFMLTFAFQGVLGASPLKAGVLLLPLSLTILLTGPLSGTLSDRWGSRGLTTVGLAVSAVAMYLLAVVPLTGPYPPVAAALVLAGLGNGMFNSPNTSAVMGSVPPQRRGVAASMRSLVFNAGQLFSIALAFTIVSTSMGAHRLAAFLAGATVGVAPAQALAFEGGLRHALYLSTALSLVAAALSFLRGASVGPTRRAPR